MHAATFRHAATSGHAATSSERLSDRSHFGSGARLFFALPYTMVRIVFAPMPLNESFVTNLTSYSNVLDELILGPNFDPAADFLVAACKDGDYLKKLGRMRQHLQTLFEFWFKRRGEKWEVPNIIVEEFSFISCTAMQKLDRCHMFYCHGICGRIPVNALRSKQSVDLIYRLREREQ